MKNNLCSCDFLTDSQGADLFLRDSVSRTAYEVQLQNLSVCFASHEVFRCACKPKVRKKPNRC
jgi:hypothetical protein